MNAPLSNASFAHAAPEGLMRPAHLHVSRQPVCDRIVGTLIALGVPVVAGLALIFGAQMAKPLIAPRPIMADIVPVKQKPPPGGSTSWPCTRLRRGRFRKHCPAATSRSW